ncbi:MAG: hypothetical protein MAG431_01362 [Chloroflexi bacterium]|nr:hypothetical protein [Chloroflexota bacterium]
MTMSDQRTIEKTYKKIKLSDQKSDFAYWQTQSYERRLEALEQIRREYHAWKYDSPPRFERVLSITKRQ